MSKRKEFEPLTTEEWILWAIVICLFVVMIKCV